jgi:hypothetical protein
MAETKRIDQVDEAASDPVDAREIAELRATVAKLAAQVAERDGRLNELYGQGQYVALKAADRAGYCTETVKNWIKCGHVDGYQVGRKWFVNTQSLAVYLTRLGLQR